MIRLFLPFYLLFAAVALLRGRPQDAKEIMRAWWRGEPIDNS